MSKQQMTPAAAENEWEYIAAPDKIKQAMQPMMKFSGFHCDRAWDVLREAFHTGYGLEVPAEATASTVAALYSARQHLAQITVGGPAKTVAAAHKAIVLIDGALADWGVPVSRPGS
jgi:hypothetical protein